MSFPCHSVLVATNWLLWLLSAVPFAAKTAATVVPFHGAAFDAALVGIDADWNISFLASDRPHLVPCSSLVRWGAYIDNDRDVCVFLADDSLLVVDQVKIGGEGVTITTDLWGPLEISRQRVRGIVLAPPGETLQRDRLWQQIQQATGIDDRILLVNGDQLTGRLLASPDEERDSFEQSPLRVVRRDGERPLTIDRNDVQAVIFNPALVDPATIGETSVRLGLRDGTLLAVERVEPRGARSELTLVGGQLLSAEATRIWEAARFIQPLSNQLTYLSDLEPASYKHIPFLHLDWPWARDRSVLGGRLRTNRTVSLKGIGMHSTSRLAYALGGQYRTFCTELALDQQSRSGGSVTFQVFLDQSTREPAGSWVLAYQSPIVRGGQPPLPISVDVSGAQRLALIVGFADRGDQLDYANWLNARLIPVIGTDRE